MSVTFPSSEPTRLPSDAQGPRLRLTLHGMPTLSVAGGGAVRLERKQAALLTYLHLSGTTPRSRLAALLWPEAGATGARGNLRQCLTRLRRLAPGALAESDEALTLAASVVVDPPVDARAAWLEACEYSDCEEFSRWLEGRIEAQRADRQSALTRGRRAAIERGDLAEAQHLAEALLALDRESEEAYRALMEVAYLRGDLAAALRTWQRCRDMLRLAYGVAPSAATQALGATVLAAAARQASPAPPPPSGLPRPAERPTPGNLGPHPPVLYGRSAELAALASMSQSHRLVTLLGIGGIGKTSLALAAAHAQRGQAPEGAWFVDLAPVSEAAQVPGAVARALGLALPSDAEPTSELVRSLRTSSMLLVLDNAEHLRAAVATLAAALIAGTSDLRLLVTSRHALRVAAEQRFQLGGLATPALPDLADPGRLGALALFEARVAALDPRFRLTPVNVAAVAEMCRRLDGLPLAIELAAARVPVLGIEALRTRLDLSVRVLGGRAAADTPRHQTLRATFDWTHALLTTGEQVLLRRLAVFVGGFDLPLVEEVYHDPGATEPGTDPSVLLDELGALIDKSLVVASAEDPPRYRLLEVTRAYALEKLTEAGELARVSDRHAHALWRRFASAESDLNEKTQGAASRGDFLRRLEPELENLRAARKWCRAASAVPRLRIGLAAASTEMLRLLGLSTEALHEMLELRDLVRDDMPAETAELYWTGLCALGTHGRLPRAEMLEVIDRAERLYRQLGRARRTHVGLYRKGFALMHLGAAEAAQQAAAEMATLERPNWPARAVALRLNLQGAIDALQQRFEASIAAFRHAAELLRHAPEDHDVVLNILANLCMSLLGAERHAEALSVAQDVLAGNPSPVVRIIAQRATLVALVFLGRLDEAATLARQAMNGWRSDDMLPHMLGVFAWLAYLRGQVADAVRLDGAARARVDGMGLTDSPVFARARSYLEQAIAAGGSSEDDVARWRQEGARLKPDEVVALCVGGSA